MSAVRNIGKDYYAIDTEGVSISEDVHRTFEKALKKLSQIPAKNLKVRLASHYRGTSSDAEETEQDVK